MKSAIGKIVFRDREDPAYRMSFAHTDFEVHSIAVKADAYEGKKTDGTEFHCYRHYWEYQPYSYPRENSVLPEPGLKCLMNFYDRSGDNWEEVTILFVGKDVFVYLHNGVERFGNLNGEHFRRLEKK